MLSEDRFLWLFNLAITGLLNAIKLRTAGQFQEAQDVIENTIEELFGLSTTLIRNIDDSSLLESLRQNGELDQGSVIIAGDLFLEEGMINSELKQPVKAGDSYQRALFFYLEAAFLEAETPPDLGDKIRGVCQLVDADTLSIDLQLGLYDFYEREGDYQQAYRMLNRLLTNPQVGNELEEEARSFYQRLLEQEDAQLHEYGLGRAELEAALLQLPGNETGSGGYRAIH